MGLASLMLVGALASCATVDPAFANITLASSSTAGSAAEVLASKLPYLSRDVILGTADDAAAYGVDLSNFEDDGYIIREQGDDVLIFGKTEEGLTAAANRFANMYKADAVEDTVYHEGYRIERLEVFGVDIEEYVIEYDSAKTADLKNAADELSRMIEIACGAKLPVIDGASDSDHVVRFEIVEDEALRTKGYRYLDVDGDLVFRANSANGCINGVYRFLQNECDWMSLTGDDPVLLENDYINIPSGVDKSETQAFEWFSMDSDFYFDLNKDRKYDLNMRYYVSTAGHGIGSFYTLSSDRYTQICYTDEEVYENIYDNVKAHIEKQLAAGYTIGVDFTQISIGQFDTPYFCTCEECVKVIAEEGGYSGGMIRFANRLSEEMNELYSGLIYKVFAYHGTNIAPKITAPNEHLYVTFCFDMNCSNHPIDGTECTEKIKFMDGERSNGEYASWFESWCAYTDNIFVYYYSLDTTLQPFTVVDTILKDFKYLYGKNVEGLRFQSPSYGLGVKRVEHELDQEVNWNIDMSEEEYCELYKIYLEKEYGPGWEYIYEFLNILNAAQDMAGCWNCWGWRNLGFFQEDRYDTYYFAEKYEVILELCNTAVSMAETDKQVKYCEILLLSAYYMGCYSTYFKAYEAEDAEMLSLLSDRYDECMRLFKKYGFDPKSLMTVDGTRVVVQEDLESAAWIDWVSWRDYLCPGHTKPAPEKYNIP